MAVGFGNMLAGIFGGLPMISEVARSSANVANGAQSRWANFFHGLFILLFLIVDVSFSDMIPLSALAALLIGVGWKLAHPREFGILYNSNCHFGYRFARWHRRRNPLENGTTFGERSSICCTFQFAAGQ
jgi:MFS superfamily sulfate permease-like transporter